MTDYRNILRLYSQGHSQREMKRELQCSRHTISAVLVQAAAVGVSWPLDDSVTNEDIQEILFPGRYAYASPYTVPDFRYMNLLGGATTILRNGQIGGHRAGEGRNTVAANTAGNPKEATDTADTHTDTNAGEEDWP